MDIPSSGYVWLSCLVVLCGYYRGMMLMEKGKFPASRCSEITSLFRNACLTGVGSNSFIDLRLRKGQMKSVFRNGSGLGSQYLSILGPSGFRIIYKAILQVFRCQGFVILATNCWSTIREMRHSTFEL